jgi:hypothetical protein
MEIVSSGSDSVGAFSEGTGSSVLELSAFTSERVNWGAGSLLTGWEAAGGTAVSAAQAQAIKRIERQSKNAKNLFFMVLPPEKRMVVQRPTGKLTPP